MSKLNGWDYVVAIEEKQMNQALKMLYEKGKLLHTFHKTISLLGMDFMFQGEFDIPTIHAIKDGLKICELTMNLKNVKMNETPFTFPLEMRIQTSLVSLESKIKNTHDRHYDVYIDFKDDNAVYNLNFSQQKSLKQLDPSIGPILETMIKDEFQQLNGHEYQVAFFDLKQDTFKEYMPKVIDFSFVLNDQEPQRSPFLLCCSLDEQGPIVENRLTFTSSILSDHSPATFWFNRTFMLHVLYQALSAEIGKIKLLKGAQLSYQSGDDHISLAKNVTIKNLVALSDGIIQKIDIGSGSNDYVLDMQIKIKALATVTAKIHFILDTKDNQLLVTIHSDKPKAKTTMSKTERIITGIATAGISEGVIAAIESITEDIATTEIKKSLNKSFSKISTIVASLASLQDASFHGHLDFSHAGVGEDGDVHLDIKRIQKKA